MQSSYEVIKRALYFQKPDRLPVHFGSYNHSDIFCVGWNQIATGDRNTHQSLDEWGCTWSRSNVRNMGLCTGHPLQNWDTLNNFTWPDPDDDRLFAGMENRFKGSEDKYVRTSIFALLFERLHCLHGLENTLIDLYEEPELLGMVADRIVDFDVRMIENLADRFPGKIHGLEFSDDWGTERDAFISEKMFNEFFAPRYKKIFDACKAVGWDVWMHSCGKINSLIPSLIKCGVTSLNMQQPLTNGIKEIGEKFSGKVCFHTSCDIQRTMVNGTDEQIENEAILLMNEWGTENGGFILSDYGDDEAIGSTDRMKRVMYEAFIKHDPWKKR